MLDQPTMLIFVQTMGASLINLITDRDGGSIGGFSAYLVNRDDNYDVPWVDADLLPQDIRGRIDQTLVS